MKRQQFKLLESKWYSKLEKSGFEDIEDKHGNIKRSEFSKASEMLFPSNRSHVVSFKTSGQLVMTERNGRAEYYRLAGFFLHDFEFSSPKEKGIWAVHCSGIHHRNDFPRFIRALKVELGLARSPRGLTPWTLRMTITRLAKQMKLHYGITNGTT